jgi:hypothetical protein
VQRQLLVQDGIDCDQIAVKNFSILRWGGPRNGG